MIAWGMGEKLSKYLKVICVVFNNMVPQHIDKNEA